jgi:CopG family transcriptional regulator/antitoxin EndoAI
MIGCNTPGMIKSSQEAIAMADRITISLPSGMLSILDSLTKELNTTRSGAIAELIRREQNNRIEQELAKGYIELAKFNKEEAELAFPSQAEVVLNKTR